MKYIVYLTTNTKAQINGINRIYIGVHLTKDPGIFDGYIGCGCYVQLPSTYMYPKTPFQKAVKKYGPESFKREILFIYDTIEEAFKKESEIVDAEFLKQSHVYNVALGGGTVKNYLPLYQFDLQGNLVKVWSFSKEAYEFYGYSASSFYFAIYGKYSFLQSFWSFTKDINVCEYSTNKWGSPKLVYLYNKDGKLLMEFDSCKACAKYIGIKDLNKALAQESLIQNKYYVSFKLVDEFKPKAKTLLVNQKFYVYKDNKLIQTCVGKELMSVINLKSWSKISDIFRYNLNWYKNFYISFEEIIKVPDKVYKNKTAVDVFDKYGNFIETLNTVKEVRIKYNVPASKIKNIQQGNKYFGNYIFKYHSK